MRHAVERRCRGYHALDVSNSEMLHIGKALHGVRILAVYREHKLAARDIGAGCRVVKVGEMGVDSGRIEIGDSCTCNRL